MAARASIPHRGMIQIWSLGENLNKRHKGFTSNNAQEPRQSIINVFHTSLGGQVGNSLGFGPVDRGSIPLTDTSFQTNRDTIMMAQGGTKLDRTFYTMRYMRSINGPMMAPWNYSDNGIYTQYTIETLHNKVMRHEPWNKETKVSSTCWRVTTSICKWDYCAWV